MELEHHRPLEFGIPHAGCDRFRFQGAKVVTPSIYLIATNKESLNSRRAQGFGRGGGFLDHL